MQNDRIPAQLLKVTLLSIQCSLIDLLRLTAPIC